MNPRKIVPIGKVFDRLTVIGFAGKAKGSGASLWECECECGNRIEARPHNLTSGQTRSCGCRNRDRKRGVPLTPSTPRVPWSGVSTTQEYRLWYRAQQRSKTYCLKTGESLESYFNIEVSDIRIPETCPVLGVPLYKGTGVPCNNSPSIDRIDPTKGYLKSNIQVISHKANRIKSDATVQELQLVVAHLQGLALKITNPKEEIADAECK